MIAGKLLLMCISEMLNKKGVLYTTRLC